ncbi:type I restriction system adenine methylase HsdM [Bifidobacterium cuniculi]|uniref:site-specific DNA-methyltransferase (adenine-specific) n=1 Tax=Bifidobacterium cuniculi TaxID=1688 RepID=A0A087B3T4_9BIFI|nr:type I restriction-modification system subunit M [Bifidobacterium cuniculi]KFI65684.1 type I restriction system adenine methylase HsdM [Bifidobacterium cuniculi]
MVNKQQLASKIWESANKMRSKIEANEYKDYILGFIFYKFLSEMEVNRLLESGMDTDDLPSLTEDDAELVESVQDICGYFIAYRNLFSTWVKNGSDFEISDVRDALSAFERNINPLHRKVYDGIFDTLQTGLSKLGNDARSQSKAVRDLVQLIKDIPMDGREDYDVLGFIYEYLISNFAANAGKKAGEFYTPHEVSVLMSEIIASTLSDRDTIKIYDPTSGSGSLLINIGQAMARRNGNPDAIMYYAQEIKENTYNLTRMNLVMRGILPDNIVTRNGDTLADDWPYFDTDANKEETYDPLFVDAVVSNPPYSQNWDPENKDLDPRFANYGVAPKSKADFAFLLHDLYHLRPDGVMTIVLPHGVLFRGGEEGEIRRNLVENHNIQAIIGLPANIFFGTGIPTIVMVLRKNRTNGDILVIDASKHFVKDGKSNKLRASDIKRIVDVVSGNLTVDKFSRLVPIEEIRENDYNLNIPRYVDSSEPPETWDIYATMFGGIPRQDLDALEPYWKAWPTLKSQMFQTSEGGYSHIIAEDVAATIHENSDVKAFRSRYDAAIAPLESLLHERLVLEPGNVDIAGDETAIGDTLERLLAEIPLVDPYDAYQELDDSWGGIANDLEVIQKEGLDAVRAVDPNVVLKKRKGKDVEEQDGWTGRILPFDLVQHALLADDVAAIARQDERIRDIDAELAGMLDEFSEDEKSNPAINEEGDGFVAAALKQEAKRIGKTPANEFEQALVHAYALTEEARKLKASVKKERQELEERTKTVIEGLDDAQARAMLDRKWIDPLMERLHAMPDGIVNGFIAQVKALGNKYETTYATVSEEISSAEQELASMLGQLTGSEYDMAGINELKKLLGGE